MRALRSVAACFVVTAMAAPAARADLTVTVTTTPNGGEFAPKNVVAAWIEVDNGPFVKTIGQYAAERKINLIAHNLISPNDLDAVSGATRLDHATPITFTWNLRDRAGNLVPDGAYRVRLEMADSNAQTTADNRQGAFLFTVGPNPETQTGLESNGFVNATVDFQPVVCSNGKLDPGETCDTAIAGSCPTACEPSGNACKPNELIGADCTAACAIVEVTECVDGDGCCAPGCSASEDSDCAGIDRDNITSGCDTGGGALAPGMIVTLALGLLVARGSRSRQRTR
ncbi:MAG TPA: hypothetical protein VFQ53_21505 [Kofleriaceae bacterium]|nr:hypothetical protein [Kofleriaceae bacterium]